MQLRFYPHEVSFVSVKKSKCHCHIHITILCIYINKHNLEFFIRPSKNKLNSQIDKVSFQTIMLQILRNFQIKPCKFNRQPNKFLCTKSKNVQIIKRTRFEQKTLYGVIINSDKNLKSDEKEKLNTALFDENVDSSGSSSAKLTNSDLSGEFHWLIEKQQKTKQVKVFKTNSSTIAAPNASKTGKEANSTKKLSKKNEMNENHPNKSSEKNVRNVLPVGKNSVILSAKNLLNQFIICKNNSLHQIRKTNNIPFDTVGLRSIINHPLIGTKASTLEVNNVLTDRTTHLPSISKVLQATMSDSARIALQRWKLKMIAELGEDGFRQYEQKTLQTGKSFHMAIENYLERREQPASDSPIINLWNSVDGVLKSLQPKPVLTEKPLVHPTLKYKGIIDSVSMIG